MFRCPELYSCLGLTNLPMEITARLNIFGLILAVWTETALAQSICSSSVGQQLTPLPSGSSETIASPNYPLHYDDYTECPWLILIPFYYPGYIVKVVFNDFTLEDDVLGVGDRCGNVDSLTFYDGSSSMSTRIGSFCGTIHPDVIYSSGRSLYVKFHTNSAITDRGFSLNYSAVKEEEAFGICHSGSYLTEDISRLNRSSGAFFSPNYPALYPNDVICVWIITVPADKRVKLTFESFKLQLSTIDCRPGKDDNDFVEIRDGQTSMNFEIGRFCYYNMLLGRIPPVLYSTGRYMRVRFRSDGSQLYARKNDKGFKAHFEAVDQPDDINYLEACFPGNVNNYNLRLTGDTGTLKSPLDLYPPNLNCSWLIAVPERKIVQLTFNKFDLKSDDYVEVLDGQYASSKKEGRFHGDTRSSVGPFRSTTRYMKVNFLSGSYDLHRYKGFDATFKAVEKKSTSGSSTMALGLGVGAGVLILIMIILCVFCNAKRAKPQDRAAGNDAGMSMATASTSASHTAQPPPPPQAPYQPANHPYPTPPVGYAPATTNPPLLPPAYPYPDSPPPPYPGTEEVPQYPPPGQSYPWLQNNAPVQPSAPPFSS